MFLTRKHLSRRTVLRGAGASIALPLLDAMVPARTALAQTAAAPSLRLGFVYFPHGALQDEWQPTGTGRDFEFPFILEPLAPSVLHPEVADTADAQREHNHCRKRSDQPPRLTLLPGLDVRLPRGEFGDTCALL